jgi:pyridinium-3,5-bisthiocarboxylic acid mononucleotide nickel chelatase
MRIAYLDCFSGISGDMFLGAAVDAGVPLEKLENVASALGLNTGLAGRRTERGGLAATKIDVLIHGRPDQPSNDQPSDDRPRDVEPKHSHEAGHPHSHAHGQHTHSHEAEHSHEAAHSHAPHVHRGLKEIREIIARAPVSPSAQAFALKTFELLAHAEAKIHNRDAESIHFHEVGSEDAIVDIVCAAVAVEAIAADRWYCSALNLGSGTVQCAHGVLPVPAPATAELLRGAPVFSSGIQKELLTPTGAAILRALEVRFEPLPRITLSATGYGAGARDFPGAANVVRLVIGESESGWPRSAPTSSAQTGGVDNAVDNANTITVLEANLDDMNPQLFSYVQQKLLSSGALDAFGVPVQMKKGRPGIVLTVLAAPADAELLTRILLTETTTLGVRMRQEQRRILDREHVTVQSCWGPIRVKLGRLQGEVVNCAPEFEDCRRIAEATGVPLKTVLQEALRLYQAPAAGPAPAAGSEALSNPAPAAGSEALPNRLASPRSGDAAAANPSPSGASKSFSS